MKKTTALLALIIALLGFTTIKTDGIRFRVEYKPGMRYNETIEQGTEATITYIGSEEFLKNLKDKGVSNPTITNKNLKMVEIMKTGKLIDSIQFPLNIEFVSTTSNDGKQIIPDGTIIYGKASLGGMPTLDSMFSPGMEDETKKVFLKTMASTLSQISFPDKELNVGDTFVHETPLVIPIAGKKIEMKIATIYKLTGVSGGLASFDIDQHYTMTLDEYTTDGSGSGSGHIVFDIAHNFYSSFDETGEMNLSMKTDDFSLKISSKNSFKQSVVFGKN